MLVGEESTPTESQHRALAQLRRQISEDYPLAEIRSWEIAQVDEEEHPASEYLIVRVGLGPAPRRSDDFTEFLCIEVLYAISARGLTGRLTPEELYNKGSKKRPGRQKKSSHRKAA